ncbi:MAG: hypothetical protein ACRCYU_17970 [Nocardioides sp.]
MRGLAVAAVAGISGLAGLTAGIAVGVRYAAKISALAARGWGGVTRLIRRDPEVVLTDADRDALTTEFATHAASVRDQVSHFADELADGDPLLRARLRHFEQHEPGTEPRHTSPWDGWSA